MAHLTTIAVADLAHLKERLERLAGDKEALAAELATVRAMIEGTSVPVFSLDREYRYLAFNRPHAVTMRALYGARIEIGQSLLDYMTVEEDREKAKRNLDRALAGESVVESAYSGEVQRLRRYFEVSHQPARAPGGQVVGVIVYAHDVTERQQAEWKLRDSEEKFAAAFHASPNLIAITRFADGTIVDVNHGYTTLLGYSRDESIGKTTAMLSIWADPADRATFIDALRRFGEITDFETTLRSKDGTLVPVIDSARTIQLQGEPCVLSVVHDMTERRRAERELARLNRALRMLSATNQALIRAADETTLLEDVCRIVVEVGDFRMAWVGLVEDDEAKTLRAVAHAGVDAENVATARVTWGEDDPGRGPIGGSIRSGQPRIVRSLAAELSFAPWRETALQRRFKSILSLPLLCEGPSEGLSEVPPLGALVIYAGEEDAFDGGEVEILTELAADVAFGVVAGRTRSLRARAEEELAKREAELSEAQRLAHIGSWDWDAIADTIWWSPEYYRIYGLDPGQPTPNYAEHLSAYTPESAARLDVEVRRTMATGEPYEVDLELARPSASTRWIVARGEAKRDAAGRIVGLRGTAQNITERKLLEEETRRLNRELEARVEERTAALAEVVKELESFSYSVSHDLRAPLRAIDGFLTLLEEQDTETPGEEGRRLLQAIRTHTRQMGRLIADLLELSRSTRAELRKVRIDMNRLVEEVLDGLLPFAERARTELRIATLPSAYGDLGLIRVVIQNLLSNALKYSAARERRVLEIGWCDGETGPEYFVRDNGVGFDPRFAQKLFGVFQRLHSASDFEGTGIGLALVRRIVNRHGGRVWAEAAVDRGATFWFTLGEAASAGAAAPAS